MQTFSLTKRPADTGGSINTRTEMHGKEQVPAHDIKVSGVIIDGPELVALTGCPSAYDALYMTNEEGLIVPRFICFAPLKLLHKFTGAGVQLWLPTGDYRFPGSSLKDIEAEGKTGGHTEISFKLQVTEKNGEHLDVSSVLNQKIHIAIRSAELDLKRDEEPELPLGHTEHTPEELEQAERDEDEATRQATGSDETLSRTGRKIQRARRKSRK